MIPSLKQSTEDQWGMIFQAAKNRDLGENNSIDQWKYMLHSRKKEDHDHFLKWKGRASIFNWMHDRFDDLGKEMMEPTKNLTYWKRPYIQNGDQLFADSIAMHKFLIEKTGIPPPVVLSHANKDTGNVQDFHLCTSIVPQLRTVLEFGPGYGREFFLFSKIPGLKYIAVDAIEQAYLLQYWSFSQMSFPMWEYLNNQDLSEMHNAKIIHLPTWKIDLIPEHSVDLAIFVWCLYEMSEEAARNALDALLRVLRPGGFVYIRDIPHQQSYKRDMDRELLKHGFKLAYYPWKHTEDELSGIPRLYRLTSKKTRFLWHSGALTHLRRFYIPSRINRWWKRVYDLLGKINEVLDRLK